MRKPLHAIIVDDELNSRTVLRALLAKYTPDVIVIADASNVSDAFDVIIELKPDLVFLDIQMPGGDGFSLLRRWDEIPFDIIFVTSFDQFAINAIRFSALDYLLKPIEVSELQLAVGKAFAKAGKREENNILIENLKNDAVKSAGQRKIAVHRQDKVKLVPVADIAYVLAETSWCYLFNQDGERFVLSKKIKVLEEMLDDEPDFVRIHKSYLINVRYITEYSKGEPCIVTMKDGRTFEVARRKKKEILEKISWV